MNQKVIIWLILLPYLFSMPLFSCKEGESGHCSKKNTKSEFVEFGYPPKIRVAYILNKNFIDISELLGFEKWGSDKMKRYINNQDTLTLSWSQSLGQLNDTFPIYWLKERLKADSHYSCEHSIFPINLSEIKGAMCEVTCKDHVQMIFFGANSFSEKHVYAKYTTRQNNLSFRDEFICLLNSMSFH